MMIQNLWVKGCDWDEQAPEELSLSWKKWLEDLNGLKKLKIERKLFPSAGWESVQLHVFGDASEGAYGAVAYLRVTYGSDYHHCSLIASKTRTSPINTMKLPRLELMAALIAARLRKTITEYLELGPELKKFCWSDSEIVLHWIKGNPSRWKQFVSNRVRDIQSLTDPSEWRHCPGKENPADICSRGSSVKDLMESALWWGGPVWLRQEEEFWLKKRLNLKNKNDEQKEEERNKNVSFILAANVIDDAVIRIEDFSRLERLLRLTSMTFHCIDIWKARHRKTELPEFDSGDFSRAKKYWVQKTQWQYFEEDIKKLQSKQPLGKGTGLYKLCPYLDEEGTLRVGGRLSNSDLPPETIDPIILPGKAHHSELIIRYFHLSNLHSGVNHTLNMIREEYWITQSRQKLHKLVKSCFPFRKILARAARQKMAPLPRERVREAFPFEIVGLDFAGPLYLKTGRGKKQEKGYVCIFTCAVTRAVHLELT